MNSGLHAPSSGTQVSAAMAAQLNQLFEDDRQQVDPQFSHDLTKISGPQLRLRTRYLLEALHAGSQQAENPDVVQAREYCQDARISRPISIAEHEFLVTFCQQLIGQINDSSVINYELIKRREILDLADRGVLYRLIPGQSAPTMCDYVEVIRAGAEFVAPRELTDAQLYLTRWADYNLHQDFVQTLLTEDSPRSPQDFIDRAESLNLVFRRFPYYSKVSTVAVDTFRTNLISAPNPTECAQAFLDRLDATQTFNSTGRCLQIAIALADLGADVTSYIRRGTQFMIADLEACHPQFIAAAENIGLRSRQVATLQDLLAEIFTDSRVLAFMRQPGRSQLGNLASHYVDVPEPVTKRSASTTAKSQPIEFSPEIALLSQASVELLLKYQEKLGEAFPLKGKGSFLSCSLANRSLAFKKLVSGVELETPTNLGQMVEYARQYQLIVLQHTINSYGIIEISLGHPSQPQVTLAPFEQHQAWLQGQIQFPMNFRSELCRNSLSLYSRAITAEVNQAILQEFERCQRSNGWNQGIVYWTITRDNLARQSRNISAFPDSIHAGLVVEPAQLNFAFKQMNMAEQRRTEIRAQYNLLGHLIVEER